LRDRQMAVYGKSPGLSAAKQRARKRVARGVLSSPCPCNRRVKIGRNQSNPAPHPTTIRDHALTALRVMT
jgi:hypothetical protein